MKAVKERIKNNIDELKRIEVLCEKFSGQYGISHKIKFEINLVLEEIITNIIKYAYQDDKEHFISVSLELEQNEIIIIVEDEGRRLIPQEIVRGI